MVIYRAQAGESVANNNVSPTNGAGDESDGDVPIHGTSKGGFSGFAALGTDDGGAAEEEEDFGGLMVCLALNRRIVSYAKYKRTT